MQAAGGGGFPNCQGLEACGAGSSCRATKGASPWWEPICDPARHKLNMAETKRARRAGLDPSSLANLRMETLEEPTTDLPLTPKNILERIPCQDAVAGWHRFFAGRQVSLPKGCKGSQGLTSRSPRCRSVRCRTCPPRCKVGIAPLGIDLRLRLARLARGDEGHARLSFGEQDDPPYASVGTNRTLRRQTVIDRGFIPFVVICGRRCGGEIP